MIRTRITETQSSRTMGWILVLLVAHIALPFAAPFASGSHPGGALAPTSRPSKTTCSQGTSLSHSARFMAGASAEDIINRKKTTLREFVSKISPSSSKKSKHEANASLVSRLFYRYTRPLLQTAAQRRLDVYDAFELPESRKMEQSVARLEHIYAKLRAQSRRKIEEERASGSPESTRKSESVLLLQALLSFQKRVLIWTGCLRLLNSAIQAFPAILVSRLLRLLEAGDAYPASKALSVALALVSVLSVKMIVENLFFHESVQSSSTLRGSLSGMIFDKSLRLPGGGSSVSYDDAKSNNTLGVGGVLNLMQSDTGIIESAALQVHTVWDGPLQIAIYTSLLFQYLGRSVVWGIGVLLLTIPINSVMLRVLNRLSKLENEAKDARTKRTAESINNMKLLKLQGWEQQFVNDINQSRSEELRRHVTRGMVRALSSAISNAVPALVLVVTLTAYVRNGQPLVASTIFTAISLFNQLRFPLFFYPMMLDSLANGKNAIKRVSSFLAADEIVPYVRHLPAMNNGGSIEMKNGSFLWSSSQSTDLGKTEPATPALLDVNLKVGPGEIVCVIGGVGSGKSALIKGLLGELNPVPRIIVEETISNELIMNEASNETAVPETPLVVAEGNIAYCSQEAWLPKGTIRNAILFGREYDEQRYLAAIRDAGLDNDIQEGHDRGAYGPLAATGTLTHDTDVGEGGNSLSGGQRARVALARALYAGEDTKVFLFDDCLANLDATVSSTVFERLTARLRRSKSATVFVTNDPSIPRRCDRVILMGTVPGSTSCSHIVDTGTYDELTFRGHDLRRTTSLLDEGLQGTEEADADKIASDDSIDKELGAADSSRLTASGRKSIRLIGGHEHHTNCTTNAPSCHADPECRKAMESCPEIIADNVGKFSSEGSDIDDILSPEIASLNTTETRFVISAVTVKKDIDGVEIDGEPRPDDLESLPTPRSTKQMQLISADDSMESGAIPFSAYVSYFRAVGAPILVVAMICSYMMVNGAQFFQQYTVAKWTEVSHGNAAAAVGAKYMTALVNAAGVVSIFLWFRSFLTMEVGVRASRFLHSRMLSSVFAAPMSFFDATPSGQLLSRFGKEMETVDRGVPDNIGAVLFCFLQIFMSMGALAGVVTPAMLAPLAAVGVVYVTTMSRYLPAARDMKRAETKSRSPIYTHFGEALRGTEIIRSIRGAMRTWSFSHRRLMDTNLSVFYTLKSLDRWLSTRLETLGNTVVLTSAIASVILTRTGRLMPGSAGWGLTQSLAITGLLTWAVRVLTDMETSMMSVVRVEELTDLKTKSSLPQRVMPKEHQKAGDALRSLLPADSSVNATLASTDSAALIADGWPWRGNVRFTNVSMRYNAHAPLVLNGVNITVPAGTTLGLVGRTGSGKSSLLLTLFRLVEIEPGGCIAIDGVDIRSVDLADLRQSLAIIPQDPVLFAGTVAYNLDATGRASHEDMWAALEAASPSLARQFRGSEGLESYISEGGSNLSLGQRQLICLARALLRKSKILVLDEATSSVDSKTDQEVQDTIRREFVNKGVTVITVAHRLDTVLGYDKIAVLGNGRVLEYGSPNELLRLPRGELRKLVNADRRNKQRGLRPGTNVLVAA